jgi:hypothetical protein
LFSDDAWVSEELVEPSRDLGVSARATDQAKDARHVPTPRLVVIAVFR